jgi:hypothetical protein
MEIQYRSKSGRLFIKIEGANMKEAFKNLASAQEVFEADDLCGCCNSPDIRFRVREVSKANKTFSYYELVCQKCYARLAFGQSQDTVSLFPKRKDENGESLPNRGWAKYKPVKEEE